MFYGYLDIYIFNTSLHETFMSNICKFLLAAPYTGNFECLDVLFKDI